MANANFSKQPAEVTGNHPESPAEVKVQLNRAGVEQVLSLYAERRSDSANEFSLTDIFDALRSRWYWLIAGAMLGSALSLLAIYFSKPLFPLAAKIVVERFDENGLSRPAGSAFVATQAQLMTSTVVLSRALADLARPDYLAPEDAPLLDAIDRLSASPISGTEVVSLGYMGPDPRYGRELINAAFTAYGAELAESTEQKATLARASKERELEALQAQATSIETAIADARAAIGLVGTAEEAAAAQRRLLAEQVDALTKIRNDRLALENQLAVGRSELSLSDPETRALRAELRAAESELARLRLTLTAEHPSVTSAGRTVSVLRRQLQQSARSTPNALRRELEILRGQEADLLAIEASNRSRLEEIETVRRSEVTQLESLAQLRELIVERERTLRDQELERLLAASGAQGGSVARMIVEPRIPDAPAWPKPELMLGAGIAFGTALALLLATLAVRRSRSDWRQVQQL